MTKHTMTWDIDPQTLHGKRALENAALLAHEANRAYCASIGDTSQVSYHDAPQWQLDSVIDGVRQIFNNPETTPEESHENWTKQKVKDGWVYGAVKDPEKKTHHCLVPYMELPEEQRYKDAIFGSVVRQALWIYERRSFQDKYTKLGPLTMPYSAHEKIKQAGLFTAIGRANLMCSDAARAYLTAAGYPMYDLVESVAGNHESQMMVLYSLSTTSVEGAYNHWRRAQWPTLHPDFVSGGPSGHYLQAMGRVQWHLIYGLAKAMAQIEGLVFERPSEDWIKTRVWTKQAEDAVLATVMTGMVKGITDLEDANAIEILGTAADLTP